MQAKAPRPAKLRGHDHGSRGLPLLQPAGHGDGLAKPRTAHQGARVWSRDARAENSTGKGRFEARSLNRERLREGTSREDRDAETLQRFAKASAVGSTFQDRRLVHFFILLLRACFVGERRIRMMQGSGVNQEGQPTCRLSNSSSRRPVPFSC